MASVSQTGWPYVQHRGGPIGFLKLVDDRTMAFATIGATGNIYQHGNIAAAAGCRSSSWTIRTARG